MFAQTFFRYVVLKGLNVLIVSYLVSAGLRIRLKREFLHSAFVADMVITMVCIHCTALMKSAQ